MPPRRLGVIAGAVIASASFLALGPIALAAPPTLTGLFPPSVGRGQSVVVDGIGELAEWPPQVWLSRPGVTIAPAADKGKLQVTAAADAQPGLAWVRLYNGDGASSPRPLMIGHFPETVEEEPNDKPDQTKPLELPRVIVGRLAKRGDADCYRVQLKTGQTLVAAVQANHLLGSPVDAVVQICLLRSRASQRLGDAREDAFVLEQNHDTAGLDPRVVCVVPSDGDYLVRVFGFPSEPDAGIALSGSDRHIYRLTLTTGEFIEHTLPSAVQRSLLNPLVRLLGRTINDSQASLAINPQAETVLELDGRSLLTWHPQWPGAIPLAVVEHPSILSEEAANAPQELSIPVTVSGRLETAGDVDSFRVTLKKNEKLRVTLQSRAVGAGLYPAAQIVDPAGKTIATYQADSTQRDFSTVFTAPEDAAYVLNVSDAGDAEDEHGFYRLTLEPVLPDFSPSLSADGFVLTAAAPLEIPITVGRSDGFAEPIEFRIDGLPTGVTAEPAISHEGESAKQIKLILKSDPSAAAFSAPLSIRGKSTGPLALERPARYSIPLPGAGSRFDVWLTVKK